MRKLLLTLLLPSVYASSILASNVALAKDGYYLSIFGGVDSASMVKSTNLFESDKDRKLETSPMGGVAYGYNYKGLDLGLSYENHTSKFKDGARTDRSIANIGLVNIAYYLNHAGAVRPYIGIGAGIGKMKVKSDFFEDGNPFYAQGKVAFAYQGKVGIAIDVSENFSIFADARMTTIMDKSVKYVSSTELGAKYTSVTFGITWNLGGHGHYPVR